MPVVPWHRFREFRGTGFGDAPNRSHKPIGLWRRFACPGLLKGPVMATWAANLPYVLLIIEEEAATAAIMATYSFVALVFPGAKRSRRVGQYL